MVRPLSSRSLGERRLTELVALDRAAGQEPSTGHRPASPPQDQHLVVPFPLDRG